VNFPLSTYSVFAKKNVSQEIQNISRSCRGSRVVRRRGQTARVQVHCSSRRLCLGPASVGTPCTFKSLHEPKTDKNDTPSCKSRG
jgi:hypothetical protein